MQTFNSKRNDRLSKQIDKAGELLINCIQDAVRAEIRSAMNNRDLHTQKKEDKELLTKKEMAEELDVSLVTLTDWMKKGLPYLRLNKRVYFQREEVLKAMDKHSMP